MIERSHLDVVSRVLDRIDLRARYAGRRKLVGRSDVAVGGVCGFFCLLHGGGRLGSAPTRGVRLDPGDLVVLLQARPFDLSPDDGTEGTCVSGEFTFPPDRARSWVHELPEYVVIRGRDRRPLPWVSHWLALMDEECRDPGPGGEAAINQLTRALLVKAVRQVLNEEAVTSRGLITALRDPHIGRAMALMHGQLARPWTVSNLADEVGMSRSAFAARFLEQAGTPPITYLLELRMEAAQTMLRETEHGLRAIARRVGYKTEAAFSTAYKRWAGVSPGCDRTFNGQPRQGVNTLDGDARTRACLKAGVGII